MDSFDFLESERPVLVDFVVSRFVGVLEQLLGAKPARVEMRILQFVIPLHERTVLSVTPHQLDRLSHNIDSLRAIHGDAVLGLQSEDALHNLTIPRRSIRTPSAEPALEGKLLASPVRRPFWQAE